MIEVRIPKEIREYQEKWLFGMTKRQLLSCLFALIVNFPLYFFLRQHLGDELAGWAIIFTAAPFMLMGFYRYNGMQFEKFVLHVLAFLAGNQKRKYMTDNIFSWMKGEYEREESSINETGKKRKKAQSGQN